MAMNVKFLKGLKASLPTSRDANTLYFVTDEGALYLGSTLIGANFTSAIEAANAAIKVINDHGYVNSTEVGTAIGTALESYYTKTEVDAKIGTLAIGDTTYNSVVEYVIAKTTGIATDSVVQGKADKVVPEKVGNIAVLNPEGNLADGGESIQEVKDYAKGLVEGLDATVISTGGKAVQVTVTQENGLVTAVAVSDETLDNIYEAKGARTYTDEEITGLEFALSEDGKTLELKNKAGTAVATLDTTDFVVDGMLSSVVADQANNKLTFTWNTDSGVQETVVELSSIADIYTGSTGEHITIAVSNENVISATLSDAVKQAIANANSAIQNLGSYTENSANGVDIVTMGSLDSKTQFKMGPMGGDVTLKSGAGDILLETVEGKAVKVNGVALGDLATKNEADLDLTSKQDALSEAQLAAANSGITATKVGEYDTIKSTVDTNKETWDKADTAVQEVGTKAVDGGAAFTVDGNDYAWLQSNDGAKLSIGYIAASDSIPAQIVFNTNGLEAAGTAEKMIGTQQTDSVAATGVYAAIQGATTNTVKDCVDAINTIGETKADKTEVANQAAVTLSEAQKYTDTALTWGSF